jgi:SSS family solute:Na+ symporter
MALHWVDSLIVIVYVLGNLLVGVHFARRQVGLQSYFLGDRSVAWWLILASIVTTETSTVTFLSVPGISFDKDGNLTFIQLAFGYVVGRAIIAWLLLPQYFKGEILSAYQVLRQRFDARVQRAASALFLVMRSIADGLRLYLTALLLHLFTDWPEMYAVVVLAIITIVYTYLGGMHAVMWTDLIQFTVKIGGALVAAACIIAWSPGGWHALADAADAAGKLTWLDPTTDPHTAYALWAGLIGGGFLTMATHGADQMMVQRYLCARSLGAARLALVLSGLVILVQFLLFLLIGVGLWYLNQSGILSLPHNVRADAVFGHFIVGALPVGLRGLVVAAVLAAAMSTLSASLNSSATAFLADFYRPLCPDQPEDRYLSVSRLMTVFWGLVQVGVALVTIAIRPERSIVNNVLAVAGWSSGIVLGLFVLGGLRRPVSSDAAVVGVISGATAVTLVMRPWAAQSLLAWPWYAAVGTVTTVVVALLADRLSRRLRPQPSRELEKA